ncbi:U32 family peptidase [Roseospira marina]|uniref:U32 family peptidase n=1 Tax=Roseospira marina TaxID=140057 RepID=A0A5M6IGH5_9PROT|nr:U32 family peptidase [Roseospira marina]KAA5606987.1 U32 family peptidase [Roseospira marina]MBB4312831.1 collagenase-like PrtC family protease [Roseospira marina]MBB5086396.1 collagenase-like PrtC family protease [Roseospira marina]
MTQLSARLALGPLLYHWSADRRRALYQAVAADGPYDTVVLGETVCAKRETPPVMEAMAEAEVALKAAGRAVIRPTIGLAVAEEEVTALETVARTANAGALVEANDVGALALLSGQPHQIGPMVNVYNEGTLTALAERGATCVTLPWELPMDNVVALAGTAKRLGIDCGVTVFGRAPLAISARCYHARANGLHKATCRLICEQDPEGLEVETLDGDPFMVVNGLQTQAFAVTLIVREIPKLIEAGVTVLRVSPLDMDMVAVGNAYADLLAGRASVEEAEDRLLDLLEDHEVANGFLHNAPGADWVAAE